MEQDLEQHSLTHAIIGAAIAVHRELGPGFVEAIYHEALKVELRSRHIAFRTEVVVDVAYKGLHAGKHRLDLVVGDEIIVELKAASEIADVHYVIVRSYLKAMGLRHGLILNFAKTKLEIRRVRVH